MSLNIADTQRCTVWKVEDKGNYTLVQMSSSRKDKATEKYKNSSWSFVRFVGKAHEKASQLEKQSRIVLKGATLSKEPYEKDGETLYPQNPTFTVFNFDFYTPDNNQGSKMDTPPVVEEDDVPGDNDEDLPF